MSRPATSAAVRLFIGGTVAAVALAPLSLASAAPALAAGPVHLSRAVAGCVGNRIDVNADGFDDAVVGNPYATVSGHQEAGSVTVLFGDADGRIGEGGRRVLTQASFGGSTVETGDHFGWSVSINDVTRNGCGALLIGSPGEDWHGHRDAGIAQLVSLTAGEGRGTPRAWLITQDDVPGSSVETGDQFGATVAAGGTFGDLSVAAVGAPGEDAGTAADAGEVDVFVYDDETARLTGSDRLRQGSGNIPGVPQAGDRFGASLLLAQLEWPRDQSIPAGPAFGVLAGAPGDVVGGRDNAGTVTAYKVDKPTVFQYSQESAGVPGAAEAGDQFGASLAVSEPRFLDAALRSVAVGSPGEDVGSVADAGLVTLFASTAAGLVPRTSFTQATARVAGAPEPGDRFGSSVAFRPRRVPTLAIGVPYEDVGSVRDAGLVQTIAVASSAGPTTSDGISVGPAYTEDSAGTPGSVAAGNRFGLALGGMAGRREDLLAVSSPYQRTGTVFLAATPATATGQTFRSWVPGQGGIPTAGSGRWGWSVAGLASTH